MTGQTFIQWNCRGFRANYEELRILGEKFDPLAFCLQETFLKPTDQIHFKHYRLLHQYGPEGERATGGSSILVRNDIIYNQVPLNTPLQAIAVQLTLHKTVTLCSIYIPPNDNLSLQDLDNLVSQLPSPYILMGDFNSHNPLWGSATLTGRGKRVEDFLANHALCILNDGSSTYLHPGYGTYSAIDLTISVPSLLLDFSWRVEDDLCGSDHFPIIVELLGPPLEQREPKWKLDKADWHSFQLKCQEKLIGEVADGPDAVREFTDVLISIAEETVPKTSTTPKRIKIPWFDDDCKKAIKDRKKAQRKFYRQPTQENLTSFKIARARARRIIRTKRRQCWKDYVSTITSRTPISKVWTMIRKIKGKGVGSCVQHLKVGDTVFTTTDSIANKLAENFEFISSSENCLPEFKSLKAHHEKQSLNFRSTHPEDYNQFFSIEELKHSLNKAHDTSTGPDKVHYQFLKHLPETTLERLLSIINNIWQSCSLPPSWREATIIPIPKPGKDHSNPTNYRPIALTSCICKTMERMINNRLVWQLESEHLISDFQCGFRRGRSTLDHLVRLETLIRDAFINKEHVVAIFFDLEKAYDTAWKYGIMRDLHNMGFRGRLPMFIASFLSDRHFRVRLNNTLSDLRDQEMGVPQGSILSVTLFNIKINSLVTAIQHGMPCSLYVDDFLICYRGKNMNSIERQLQITLNKIHKWSVENGFKFSKSKTVSMHFCQLRTPHNDPELTMDGTPIRVVKETKFLGLLLDNKLTFLPHIKSLKTKCLKALDILKVLSSAKWGADSTVLLQLYRALIRSKLDYGSMVYGSARKSYVQLLDTIHHQGLRLALGAFRTSPVQSLYVEGHEPSLENRRLKLALQYVTKLKTNTSNPAYDGVFHPGNTELYEARPNYIQPLGVRIKPHMENLGADFTNLDQTHYSDVPPWHLQKPNIILKLAEKKKSETHPLTYCEQFLDVRLKFPSHHIYYTDGSRDNNRVSAAAVTLSCRHGIRIPNECSIFTAEARALLLALEQIETSNERNFLICTDSISCLHALNHLKTDHPLLNKIFLKLNFMTIAGYDIHLCWVPGHVGLPGNEVADQTAKRALSAELMPCLIPPTDLRPVIRNYISRKWQNEWNECPNNKLYSISPSIAEPYSSGLQSRRDQVVITRCRIGHSRLTHVFLVQGERPPECVACQCPLTLKHLLIDCTDFLTQRQRFYQVATLQELFSTVKADVILAFLKASGLYTLL